MLKKFNSFIEKWMALVTPTCLLLGVCFPDIAKCGLPYVPAVFAFMTFAGALKSRFKDVANVFRHPGSLLIIMLLVHVVIPTAACGAGHLFFGNNMELITGMVLEFAVPTAVVSLMWVTIYDGNSPLSLSLVVLDTVLAPFLIPGYAEDPAGLCGDHRSCQDDAGTDIYGCASCCCCDGIKSDHRWKSNGNMAGKAGAFFKAGTDICGNVQFFQSSTIYPGYEYAEGEGCTGNPCPGCFRICTRLVYGVYLPKGSQYGGFHDVWNRDAQYQRRSGDRSCIFSG